jgi:phosphoribosylformylglycinamidine cyclo-ligase
VAEVAWGSWPVQAIFDLVAEVAGASERDLRATFNLGVGMVLVVPGDGADEVLARAVAAGTAAFRIGSVGA